MVVQKHVRIRRFVGLTAGVAALLVVSGPLASCAQTSARPMVVAGAPADPPMKAADSARNDTPPPKAEDCAIVTVSTPIKYACEGKVYTSYELQHLREKWEAAHK